MRDARVEEVEHVSDSDSEEREDIGQSQARLTVAIYPAHQGPTYLILPGKLERDNWLYHLTVVSGGGPNAGTQYEQLVQKLMETDGDPSTKQVYLSFIYNFKKKFTPQIYRLRNVAPSNLAAHQRTNHFTVVFPSFRNASIGSN